LQEGVNNSCNAVFITLGQRLGTETLYKYIRAFSFGTKTGLDYPGEATGLVIDESRLRQVDLARVAFGQAISVTPLQMVSAAATIANGGLFQTPHLVDYVMDSNGNQVDSWKEHGEFRQVISGEDSERIRGMLEKVVSEGTGRNAYIPGYRVAGKTGTAQKVVDGVYADGKYVASFLGFAPADEPRLAMIVVMDEPSGSVYYGGQVAAPVFKNVMHEALQYLEIMPDTIDGDDAGSNEQDRITVPDMAGRTVENAKAKLENSHLRASVQGTGTQVLRQFPEAGEKILANSIVRLFTGSAESDRIKVPDVSGMTMRGCAEILEMYGLNMTTSGSGTAQSQEPDPGTEVDRNSSVHVQFE
jgi:stage V sporulation protein D (sporulation-specific penicillin-binding protein)